jgi:hypothetical protein
MAEMWTYARVATELGMSVPSVRAWVKAGKLPPPLVISPVCRRWPVEQIRLAVEKIKATRVATV